MERMTQVQDGDTAVVHYTGKLEGGTVFDTKINRDSPQFRIDEGQIIPLFEQAIVGMEPGSSKIIEISADEAYGLHYDELVLTVGSGGLFRGRATRSQSAVRGSSAKMVNRL